MGLLKDLASLVDPAPAPVREPARDADGAESGQPVEKLPYRSDPPLSAAARRRVKRVSRQAVGLDPKQLGLAEQRPADEEDATHQTGASEVAGRLFDADGAALSSGHESDTGWDVPKETGSTDTKSEPTKHYHTSHDEPTDVTRDGQGVTEASFLRHIQMQANSVNRQGKCVAEQQAIYDAAVRVRIKVEPAVAMARRFPVDVDDEIQEERATARLKLERLALVLENAAATLADNHDEHDPNDSDSSGEGSDSRNRTAPSEWRDLVVDSWYRKIRSNALAPDAKPAQPSFKVIDDRPSAQIKLILDSKKYQDRCSKLREPIDMFPTQDGTIVQPTSETHYDDGELYRSMLRDIIDSDDASVVNAGLRHAELARSGRIRKKIDRRASKGKKLRYVVHDKLVGFLAPQPMPDPGPVDEILNSLFGRTPTLPT